MGQYESEIADAIWTLAKSIERAGNKISNSIQDLTLNPEEY